MLLSQENLIILKLKKMNKASYLTKDSEIERVTFGNVDEMREGIIVYQVENLFYPQTNTPVREKFHT